MSWPGDDDDCDVRQSTSDSHIVVHLWRERSSPEIRARLRSPAISESITAVGTEAVQASVAAAIERVCGQLQ